MKVLLLPINIGSGPSITTEALNKIEGVEAKCITNIASPLHSGSRNTIFIPKHFPRKKPIQWLYHKVSYKSRIRKWIKWADVLHYIWEPAFDNAEDLQLGFELKKPIFVEWLGGDIRKPEWTCRINKFYKEIFDKRYEYYQLESSDHSDRVQRQFSTVGALPLLVPEMSLYLDKKYFPGGCTFLMQRMNIHDFKPSYPEETNSRPLLIHSPSAKICKGTPYIMEVIKELKKDFDFDFRLIENLPRKEALRLMSQCDIFIDQLILGGYGAASIEAMSFGKPALCYIMEEVFDAGLPEECPIVNSHPENLKENLVKLLMDPSLRRNFGMQGRAYVEKHHDADKIALELKELYERHLKAERLNVKEALEK